MLRYPHIACLAKMSCEPSDVTFSLYFTQITFELQKVTSYDNDYYYRQHN